MNIQINQTAIYVYFKAYIFEISFLMKNNIQTPQMSFIALSTILARFHKDTVYQKTLFMKLVSFYIPSCEDCKSSIIMCFAKIQFFSFMRSTTIFILAQNNIGEPGFRLVSG